jgi:hypothetical protein
MDFALRWSCIPNISSKKQALVQFVLEEVRYILRVWCFLEIKSPERHVGYQKEVRKALAKDWKSNWEDGEVLNLRTVKYAERSSFVPNEAL